MSDLAVNRYQYALSVGREKIRMFNEKMQMASQTVLNWLGAGADYLKSAQNWIKKSLLRKDSTIYSDETWVNVREVGTDGRLHYVKRYMWVIVNATTNVCYYLFGNRSKSVITEFLNGFKGTMMTDAYAAYTYFNNVKDFMHLCCWAHVRRIFYSAKEDYKDLELESFLTYIGLLYKVELEDQLLHRDESEIVEARRQESIPILHKLKQDAELLLSRWKAISSKLEQAVNYMLNNWSQLISYVNVGNADIDNIICYPEVWIIFVKGQ